tara:strand:+ start:372 stop:512 length:141 start_codon:yes stop_codon:yes gene_type:complete
MSYDRMADHEDWRDGMNVFRSNALEELSKLREELNKIKNQIKENPK